MAKMVKSGWTVYDIPADEKLTDRLSGALKAYVDDCRYFAKIARQAQLDELPSKLGFTWEEFCDKRLHQSSDLVEAIIVGIEFLGEAVPVPASVAETVGRRILGQREIGIPGGKAGPGRGNKTGDNITRLSRGTSAEYWKARIERDRPDIFARLSEFKSVRAAAIEAGIVKPPTVYQQLKKFWLKASTTEKTRFKAWMK